MKKTKLIVTLMLVAVLVASIAIPAMAATNSRNPSLGYDFSWGDGERTAFSANSMTKQNASDWVVYVTRERNNTEDISYAMLWTLYSDWDWCVGSLTAESTGDGSTVVGQYYNAANMVGMPLWAGAIIHQNDVGLGVTSVGSWNADAQ